MNPVLQRAALAALALVLVACGTDNGPAPGNPLNAGARSERELRLEAEELYRVARKSLDQADYQGALLRYSQVQLRYPFTDYATQSQLETIYAKFRAFDADGALTAADRFLKEHPRHASVDYVHYLKGLINSQRGEGMFDDLVDTTAQDVSYARRAFDDFALLTQRHPNSRYAADARLRMLHLRNRIAAHELAIARFYVRRGAHVAAARRAEDIVANYPGAPATAEALVLLENSYREAGLAAQAEGVRRLREANPGLVAPRTTAVERPGGVFGPPPDPIPEPSAG
jgi:outer membrane protein assembly factor BamD